MANETTTAIVARLVAVGVVIAAIVFASVDGSRDAIIAALGIIGGVAVMFGWAVPVRLVGLPGSRAMASYVDDVEGRRKSAG